MQNYCALFLLLTLASLVTGQEAKTDVQQGTLKLPKSAKPIPATRKQMKEALDALKQANPRLPLPEDNSKKGVNNGRMRNYYVPGELRVGGVGGFGGDRLDATFNTQVFWIVCRVNNCQYCLGHQESKLASAGVPEDTIAALDFDWAVFSDKERLAFGLARKLSFQPHLVGPPDIDALTKHYSNLQILNLISSIAGFNAMNRWTDGLAIPQEKGRNFQGPISAKYKDAKSTVALLTDDKGCLPASVLRPAAPTRAQIDDALAACRKRSSWVDLASAEDARKLMPAAAKDGPVPHWVRLYAISKAGQARVAGESALRTKGNMDAKLRARISWIAAYHDRAWYALGQAEERLRGLGESDQDIMALAGSWSDFSAKDRAVFRVVRILTVTPMSVTDGDVEALREHFSDAQVAEVVHRICEAAYFNRVTEATQLPLEKTP